MSTMTRGTVRRLSGSGRSAIAVIEVRGDLAFLDDPDPLFRAANGRPVSRQVPGVICFGEWGFPGEEIVLCRIDNSTVEITCHGGEAAIGRIMSNLRERGYAFQDVWHQDKATCPTTDNTAGERPDASVNEMLHCLCQARTQRTAEIILEQAQGRWGQWISEARRADPDERFRQVTEMQTWLDFGRHLIEPWKVVLCGRPNVGKSSLMNSIAGFTRSIVSEIPGTTRDRVTLDTAIDGWPVLISDTAGIRDSDDPIEKLGIERALAALRDADLVVIVLDGTASLTQEDQLLLATPCRRRIVVCHKSDLPEAPDFQAPHGSVRVSSVRGDGVAELLSVISRSLIPVLPIEGQAIPVTQRHVTELGQLCDLRNAVE